MGGVDLIRDMDEALLKYKLKKIKKGHCNESNQAKQ